MDGGSAESHRSGALFPQGFVTGARFIEFRGGTLGLQQDGLGGWGFPYEASRSYFLGSDKPAAAEVEDCN